MAVNWKHSSVKVPVADYRNWNDWIESNRYQELLKNANKQKVESSLKD
jgi:hypothetical protein